MHEKSDVRTKPATEAAKLHPGGVLDQMKALYARSLASYMANMDGELELKEECAEAVSCYLCGGGESASFLKASGFRYVQCADCGLVYVNPRLRADLIGEFYKSESYNFMFQNLLIKNVDYRLDVIASKKLATVKRYFPQGTPKLLDIGCGIGDFAHLATQEGWSAEAIEFSPKAAAFARERFGLSVHQKPMEECDFAAGQFDLATMWGVLEHLVEPRELLGQIRHYLAADGLLALEVPSYDCLLVEYLKAQPEQADRIVDGWGHLMLFSVPTITRMLEEQGYVVEEVQSLGLDIQTVLRYVKTAGSAAVGHPVFKFLEQHSQPLQECLETMHKADMIRAVARKKGS